MAIMLEKAYNDYYTKYLREGAFSWAVAVNRNKYLLHQLSEMRVVPVKGHPPFDKVKSYKIVKCGKIWVVLGKVMCNFIDGQKEENFELVMGIDKHEIAVWWDLNSPNHIEDSKTLTLLKMAITEEELTNL